MFRYLLVLLGILLALPALALTALAAGMPITASGAAYLIGCWLIVAGLILGPWRPKVQLALVVGGVTAIALVATIRIGRIATQTSNTKVVVLPSAGKTRWINSLIDEQDSILFGEKVLHLVGGVTAQEHDNIVPALSAAYAHARSTGGAFPSPVLSTYLGLQKPNAFDTVVIEPAVEQPATVGLVFLHGFMGNVTVQCWQIAEAAEKIGAVTACPSTSWIGDWWEPEGEAIVRATLSYLRGRGIERFYLGGFSNGGGGVGMLTPALAREPGLRGLFFVAGASNWRAVRESGLPVLIIQGTRDERMPAEAARQFADEVGDRATYVELDADHFLIMKQSERVQAAISTWLVGQERDAESWQAQNRRICRILESLHLYE